MSRKGGGETGWGAGEERGSVGERRGEMCAGSRASTAAPASLPLHVCICYVIIMCVYIVYVVCAYELVSRKCV